VSAAASTGLCRRCGEPLIGFERTTRKYCDDECRHAFHVEQHSASIAKAVADPRRCRCNSNHILGHDFDDGQPRCQKCGAEIEGKRIAPLGDFDLLRHLMDAEIHRVCRPKHRPWESAHERPNFTTEVTTYLGRPFEPDSEVQVRPASSFQVKKLGKEVQ
jgi:hypothetical protein